MQILVFQEGTDDMTALEVPEDADVFLLIQLVAAETGKDLRSFHLEYDGNPMPMTATLMQLGVFDGAAVILKRNPAQVQSTPGLPAAAQPVPTPTRTPNPAPSAGSSGSNAASGGRSLSLYDIPADIKPDELLELTKAHPNLLQQFIANDPELGNCLATKDLSKVRALMMKRFMNKHKEDYSKEQEIRALEADPMNPELQKKIEERVRGSYSPDVVFILTIFFFIDSIGEYSTKHGTCIRKFTRSVWSCSNALCEYRSQSSSSEGIR